MQFYLENHLVNNTLYINLNLENPHDHLSGIKCYGEYNLIGRIKAFFNLAFKQTIKLEKNGQSFTKVQYIDSKDFASWKVAERTLTNSPINIDLTEKMRLIAFRRKAQINEKSSQIEVKKTLNLIKEQIEIYKKHENKFLEIEKGYKPLIERPEIENLNKYINSQWKEEPIEKSNLDANTLKDKVGF